MCRYISEQWLYAFLKSSSKCAPNSFHAPTLSIHLCYPEPTVILSLKSDFLSLSVNRFSNPRLQTPYQPVLSSSSFSLLPVLLFSSSDTALDCLLAHITKIRPVASLQQLTPPTHLSHQLFSSLRPWFQALLSLTYPCVCLQAQITAEGNYLWEFIALWRLQGKWFKCCACVCFAVGYLFCTMIMAIQSQGYTCFPIRSLKSRNDSIRKSCNEMQVCE